MEKSEYIKDPELREADLKERINKLKSGETIELTPAELGFGGMNMKEAAVVADKADKLGLTAPLQFFGSDYIPSTYKLFPFTKR